jgi:hypothetical protein
VGSDDAKWTRRHFKIYRRNDVRPFAASAEQQCGERREHRSVHVKVPPAGPQRAKPETTIAAKWAKKTRREAGLPISYD